MPSKSQGVTVLTAATLLSTVPGGADALPAGGGAVVGTAAYDPGGEMPALGASCAPTRFSLHLDVPAFVLDGGNDNRYAGPMALSGTGTGTCETQGFGGGRVDFDVSAGDGLDCGSLAGYYTRTAGVETLMTSGPCTLNGVALPRQNWIFTFSQAPTNTIVGTVALLPV
jgi:hypothetical protein